MEWNYRRTKKFCQETLKIDELKWTQVTAPMATRFVANLVNTLTSGGSLQLKHYSFKERRQILLKVNY